MGEKDDIFTDEFPDKKPDPKSPPKDKDDSWDIPDQSLRKPPKSNKKYIAVGAIVVGLIIVLAYFTVTGFLDGESFDDSQCQFDTVIDFNGKRCMTQQEYEANVLVEKTLLDREQSRPETEKPQDKTRDITSASDKVEVLKTDEVIGYFMVKTDDDWYGDFVDFRKIPNKIEKSGSLQVNFRCYTDEFQGISTYFGTFRNVIQPDLTVEVYLGGTLVDIQRTDSNKALILEGSCFVVKPTSISEPIKVETVSADLPDVVTMNTTGN